MLYGFRMAHAKWSEMRMLMVMVALVMVMAMMMLAMTMSMTCHKDSVWHTFSCQRCER